VTAIDYSLAPELPYPESLNDIERVYRSLSMNNSSSILLMGDSAGGNLMAALSLPLSTQRLFHLLMLNVFFIQPYRR